MPALKSNTIFLTDEEDTLITAAASSDPDTVLLTNDEWEQIKPSIHVANQTKQAIYISFDTEIMEYFRTTGCNWQINMNNALKEWMKEHHIT
jgi:uncharacterized protein (DUF4415 family)